MNANHKTLAFGLALATTVTASVVPAMAVALPTMAASLNASVTDAAWTLILFSAASGLGFALTGWLVRRFGDSRLYGHSLALFVLASVVAAIAPDLRVLLAVLFLQGLATGPIASVSLALLLSAFPSRGGTATAIWVFAGLVALILGPLLAGAWIALLSWHWIFALNVPLGLFVLLLFARTRPAVAVNASPAPMDWLGLGLLVALVGSLLGVLHWSNPSRVGPQLVGWLLACAGLLVMLARHALTHPDPILNVRVAASARIGCAMALVVASFALFWGHLALLPAWLHRSLGYTIPEAGGVLAVAGVAALAATPFAARFTERGLERRLIGGGLILMTTVLWMRATWQPGVPISVVMLASVLQGIATSLIFIPATSLSLSGQSGPAASSASGLLNFFRATAGAMGIAAQALIFEALHARHTGPVGSPGDAWAGASTDLFWLTGSLFLALLLLVAFIAPSARVAGSSLNQQGGT